LQAYGLGEREIARFGVQSAAARAAELAATRIRALFAPVTDLFEIAGVLLILGLGMVALVNKQLTLGDLLAFLLYLSQLYAPAQALAGLVNTLYAATAGAERGHGAAGPEARHGAAGWRRPGSPASTPGAPPASPARRGIDFKPGAVPLPGATGRRAE